MMSATTTMIALAMTSAQAKQLPGQLEDQSWYLARWPAGEALEKLKGRAVFYGEHTMRPCHQDFDGALQGVADYRRNKSGNASELYGNPNMEFPWAFPFGIRGQRPGRSFGGRVVAGFGGIESFRFFALPQGKRVLVWRQVLDHDTRLGPSRGCVVWQFPQGTVFGEALLLGDKVFEVRTRERVGEQEAPWSADAWRPKVYRPYSSRADLESAGIRIAGKKRVAAKDIHGVFDEAGELDLAEKADKATAAKVLARPFVESAGYAPTSDHDGIVPTGYFGGLVKITKASCNRCHATSLKHVDEFDATRDWYGRVRGGDSVFSWHPFANSTITADGTDGGTAPRAAFNGILQYWGRE